MSRYTYVTKIKVAGLFLLALAACSNNNSGTGGGRDSYTLQVNAFGANLGLGTAALTLTETNSGQSLTFSGTSASQTLDHQFASGDAYNFSIANPSAPAQTCALSASSPPASGTVASNLTFDITCTIVTVNVSGSITGLTGAGLVLQISNGTPATEAITSASNGSFSFKVPSGSTWAISAAAQPTGPSETCSGPSSTAPVGSTDITGLVVTCTPVPYTVTAIVSGLQGTGLTLTDGVSGTVPVAVNKNGPFTVTFPNVPAGSGYSVAQAGQVTGPSQTCAVDPSGPPQSGTIAGNLTFNITCTTAAFNVSGSIAGLTGSGLVLQISNGSPATETITTASSKAFSFKVPSGSSWAISAAAQPTGPAETCSGPSSTAPVGSTDITGLVVTCTPVPYTVTAIVAGLQGTGLTLTDGVAGTAPIAVNKNGPFTITFPNVPAGSAYALAPVTQVTGPSQTCAIDSSGPPPSGTISGNLTFNVTCTTTAFNVSGSIAGLTGSGLVLQITNGTPATEQITTGPNGTFSFKVLSGSSWAITAAAEPTGPAETCTGPSSTAPVGAADVTGLVVTCTPVPYTVTTTVVNLLGTGLTLTDGVPGTTPIAVPVNKTGTSTIKFPSIPAGTSYTVAQVGQVTNPSQTCGATPGTSATDPAINSDVQVSITCMTNSYQVSFTLSNSTEKGIQATLLLNGTPYSSLLVTCNSNSVTCSNSAQAGQAKFNFPNLAPSGSEYQVTISAQNDATQNCYVWNVGGSGTVGGTSPPIATVQCANVPLFALTGGHAGLGVFGESPAAYFYTLNDPGYSSGALTPFADDAADENSTQPPAGTGILFGGCIGMSTCASFFAPNPSTTTPLIDYLAVASFNGASASSKIANYTLLQPTVLNPGPSFVPYTESSSVTSVPGAIVDMVLEPTTQTLSVCYNIGDGFGGPGPLFFQAYSIQSDTSLNAIGMATQLTANDPSGTTTLGSCSLLIAATNSGNHFVYAFYGDTVADSYYLSGFQLGSNQVQPTGLIAAGPLTLANPHGPQTYIGVPSIDPLGRFAYVQYSVCIPSGPCVWNINGFSISTTGALASVGGVLAAEGSVNPLLYEPSGTFAYLPNGSTLTPYSIDPVTGAFGTKNLQTGTDLIASPIGQTVDHSNIDPSGTYIFLVAANGQKLLSYTINPVDGSLFELPALPAPASTTYSEPTVDPSGQWVYAPTVLLNPMNTAQSSTSYSVFTFSTSGLQALPKPPAALPPDFDFLQTTGLIFQ